MRITYHAHSGFSVRTDRNLLIFDYLGEGLNAPEPSECAVAFVSHSHHDHFHPSVVRWMQEGRVLLITGDDVDAGGIRMAPGQRTVVGDMEIEAFDSTDQGVSFLVKVGGVSIFHAGDLNLWHWKNESDDDYVREAEQGFAQVLDTLRGRSIDLAFFPVDPRMGEGYEEGALRFIEVMKPGHFIPMHFWNQPEAALVMKDRKLPDSVQVHVLTAPGEELSLDISREETVS